MVELKVGDHVTICAAVWNYYSTSYQQCSYYINDVDISTGTCIIAGGTNSAGCPGLSGIQVEFQWTNSSSSSDTNNCTTSSKLKTLGTAVSGADGKVSISYNITAEDASFYNSNNGFELRACITSVVPTLGKGRVRGKDPIIIRGSYTGNSCIIRNTSTCINPDQTLIVYENPAYASGTITNVCVYRSGSSAVLPQAKIKVFRLTGTTWSVVGESGYLPLANDAVTAFNGINIVVQKGDYVGLYIQQSSTYPACPGCNSFPGLNFAKVHGGDVVTNTDDSTWSLLNVFAISISATLVPCQGVTCPDICGGTSGFDLYHQTCINGICTPNPSPFETNSATCGYIPPTQNMHELYFKVPDIIPIWYIQSLISSLVIQNVTEEALKVVTNYYVYSVNFDVTTYIVTITIASLPGAGYPLQTNAQFIQPIQLISDNPSYYNPYYYPDQSDVKIQSMFIFLVIPAWLIYIIAMAIASALAGLLFMLFRGSKQSGAGLPPSTRNLQINANICTANATTGQITCNPLTDPNMIVLVKIEKGKDIVFGNITKDSPTLSIDVPTNVDINITANVKDNPYYTTFTVNPQTNPSLASCEPGGSCPTTIPITIKLKAQADATANNGIIDTSGNPLPGKYKLFIESSEGHMVEDGAGDLIDGKIPATKVPADKPYCAVIYPSDYPTHDFTMKCYTPGAGQTSGGNITLKNCQEEKNKVSVRTVYIANDGSRLSFTASEIDIINIATNQTVRTMRKDSTVEADKITSDVTVVDGLENGKTYRIHVVPNGYTVTTETQDQQVSYTTDCQTTIILTVEANPPPNTSDITINVRNSVTLTGLQGASVTLGDLPAKTTGALGSVLFAAFPYGSGIPLNVTLTGYKNYDTIENITTAQKTITVDMEVDQVLATIDTRISNYTTIGDIIATKSVKFKGTVEYFSASYSPLTDVPVTVTVKDKDNNVIQTLSTTSSSGVLGTVIGAGDFETGEWLVPDSLVNTQISATATFEGAGQYKPSTVTTTYVVAKAADCAIPIPFTNSCLLSKETGTALLMIGGLVIGGYVVYKLTKLIPSKKGAEVVTKVVKERKEIPTGIPTGKIFEIKPVG